MQNENNLQDGGASSSSDSNLSQPAGTTANHHSSTFHSSRFLKQENNPQNNTGQNNSKIVQNNGISNNSQVSYQQTSKDNLNQSYMSTTGGNASTLNQTGPAKGFKPMMYCGENVSRGECSLQTFELPPEVRGMAVVLRFIGVPSHKVVDEIARMGFKVTESNVISCWDDWTRNRSKVGRTKNKYEQTTELRGKEKINSISEGIDDDADRSKFLNTTMQETSKFLNQTRQSENAQRNPNNNGSDCNNSSKFEDMYGDQGVQESELFGEYDDGDNQIFYDEEVRQPQQNQLGLQNHVANLKKEQNELENNPQQHSNYQATSGMEEEEIQTEKPATTDNQEDDAQPNVNTHCLFFHQDTSACIGCESAGETNVVATSCLQCDLDAGISFKLCQECFDIRHGLKPPILANEKQQQKDKKYRSEMKQEADTSGIVSFKQYNSKHGGSQDSAGNRQTQASANLSSSDDSEIGE